MRDSVTSPYPAATPVHTRTARGPFAWERVGWSLLLVLALWRIAACLPDLWAVWRSEPELSHGPLIPFIAGAMLWGRRSELRRWRDAWGPGLALAVLGCLLSITAEWADIDFLKPLAVIILAAGLVGFLGGQNALAVSAGALGFLLFMIPWPTTVTDRIGFPIQLASSAYAAQFAGMLGLPVVRDGVQLAVVPYGHAHPVYEIVVAQRCSGMTSLIVLLALGYLMAYLTPAAMRWRVLMVGLVIPVSLVLNAIRLTLVLVAGADRDAALARWVHDHEQPVLIFLCSLCLLGLRRLLPHDRENPPRPVPHREYSDPDS